MRKIDLSSEFCVLTDKTPSMFERELEQPWVWHPVERKCLALLQSCRKRASLLQIHAFMLRHAIDTNVNLFTKFVTAFSSSNAGISYARKVFDHRLQIEDSFLCNSMLKSYQRMRQFSDAFHLYSDLRREIGFVADNFTFMTLANSCASSLAVCEGFQIHGNVIRSGFGLDMYVLTGLVDMYAKFGKMRLARKVFDELPLRSRVSWTALICGYARFGDMVVAREIFDEMPEAKDTVVYNAIIDGYAKSGDMKSARSLFDEMPDRNVVSWTTMIYGYCSNGEAVSARSLFDAMPEKNLFSWNAMIGGYCQNKQPHEALRLFQEMQSSTTLVPDEVTVVSVLPAIADLGALDLGEWIHGFVQRKKLDRAMNVSTALLDMYAKCGQTARAKRIFDEMPDKEIASWNALINGYAVNGDSGAALEVFMKMQNEGVKPNEVSVLGALTACNHGGLVKEGKRLFESMCDFGLIPQIEHYGCMVDLLGRAGHVDEAESLIKNMPFEPNGIILSSFLSACGYKNDLTRAERLINKAVSMEPRNQGNYIMLMNLYASARRWNDVEVMRRLMRKNETKKEAGCSVIEVESRVSEFVSGDAVHPQTALIHVVLKQLFMHMEDRLVCVSS